VFIIEAIGGVLCAMLPARLWPWLDRYVPASGSAGAAGVLTVVVGGVVALLGFIDYAQDLASAINDLALTTPGVAEGSDKFSTLTLQGVTGASSFGFFLTPRGILAIYLVLTGLVRALSAIFGEPSGDPLLTWADRAVQNIHARVTAARDDRARLSLEGPDVPDRVVRGEQLRLAADLVIVAARRKPGWDQGTIVHSGDRWFRLGPVEERTIDGRLRTLYPLSELRDQGVIRRLVEYEMPAGFKEL
jgi:hypothetical protein